MDPHGDFFIVESVQKKNTRTNTDKYSGPGEIQSIVI